MRIRHYGKPKNWVEADEVKEFIKDLTEEYQKRIQAVIDKDNCENIKQTGTCSICDNVQYAFKDAIDFINEKKGDDFCVEDVE